MVRVKRARVIAAWLGIAAVALPGVPSAASAATFNFINNDGADEGFNDPTLGPARIAAFQYALGVWDSLILDAYGGETINVLANMDPLGGTATSAVLGYAGVQTIHRNFGSANPAYQASTWYGGPLGNHLDGSDLWPTDAGNEEIAATFNSDIDGDGVLGTTHWYYGTDANPLGDIDFATVVLHEMGHGLNFFDLIDSSDGSWEYDDPGIYDRFLTTGSTGGTALTAMTDAQRKAAITSGDLYWMGGGGMAGNGGNRPEMFAPSPYQPGSSVSHLDEAVHTNELMSPYYSGADHIPSDMELGMLRDMGWNIVPEPGELTMVLGLAGMGLVWYIRRRKKSA